VNETALVVLVPEAEALLHHWIGSSHSLTVLYRDTFVN